MSTTTVIKNRAFSWVLLVALIIGLAFTIRVWNLTKESFWADEGWTMLLAKGPTIPDVVQTMANDQHPPLYFVLMHIWIDLAGNSEFTTRFLSLAWSVLGVALIYRLGTDLFSRGAGAATALMLALADNDTFLAQDARHYTQMATLATCSTLFYLRYYRNPTRTNGIMWLLSSVALLYTHYLGAFILIVQLIHMLLFMRPLRRLGDMLLRWLAIGLAWAPWAFVFVNQSLVRYTRPILYQSTWPDSPEALSIVRNDLIGSHFGLTGGLLLLGLAYVSYAAGTAKIRWKPAWSTMYALLWLAIPVITIIAINPVYPILTTRNFLIVTPVIALLIGHGIMNLDRFARTFVLVILVSVSLITVDAYFVKPPWRQVAQDILQFRADDEPVIMNVWTDDFALRYHIGRDLNADPATLPLVSVPEWQERYGKLFDAKLVGYLNQHASFWLAYWGDKNSDILKFITDHGFTRTATQVETHLQTNLIFVYRYDRVPATAPLAVFGDQFALLSSSVEQKESTLTVGTLWKVLQKPSVDYSFSIFVLDNSGHSIANIDSPPMDGKTSTSSLQVGDVQFDRKVITLPAGLALGVYSVAAKIYWYVDQKPLTVTAPDTSPAEYLVLKEITIPGSPN